MNGRVGRITSLGLALLLLALTLIAKPAQALVQEYYVGPANGAAANWNTTANWSTSAGGADGANIPGVSNVANILTSNGTTETVIYDYTGAAVTISALNIDLTGGVSGATNTLNMPGNTLTVSGLEEIGISGNGTLLQTGGTNTANTGLYLGLNANSNGTYTLNGATAALLLNQFETVGQAGVGNFNLLNGSDTVGGGNALFVGGAATGLGTVTIGTTGGGGAGMLSVSGNEAIGFSGAGNVVQYSGSNTLTGASSVLYLGYNATASGVTPFGRYTLNGGTVTAGGVDAAGISEYIGYNGLGSFTQAGGNHTVAGALALGGNAGAGGGYTLSGGTVTVSGFDSAGISEYVGENGTGSILQTGGTHNVASQLVLAGKSGSTGTYNLTAGNLAVGAEAVGNKGSGIFTQTGGVHTINGALNIGQSVGSSGSFILSGGSLADTFERIGNGGTGTFTQSGGTHIIDQTIGLAELDIGVTGLGTFNLNNAAATLYVDGNELVGDSAASVTNGGVTQTGGTFAQSAGSHTITGYLDLGETPTGTGTFLLSGGALAVSTTGSPHFNGEDIGYAGAGTFLHSGGQQIIGTTTTNQDLNLGYASGASGAYTMNNAAASLTVNGDAYVGGSLFGAGGAGVLNISAGAATITGMLKIWPTTGSALNLSGGSLTVGSLDSSSLSRIHWTGGTLGFLANANIGTADPLGTNLSLNAGQTLNVAGVLTVDPSGSFTLNGGTLIAANIINNSTQGNPAFIFTAGSAAFSSLTSGSVVVSMPLTLGSGTTFTAQNLHIFNGGNVLVSGAAGRVDNLTLQSGGSGAPASFTQTSGTFSIGLFTVSSGARFNIATGNTITCDTFDISAASLPNSVNITGGSLITTTLSIDNFSNSLVISSGSVTINETDQLGTITNNGQIVFGNYSQATLSFLDSSFDNFGIITGSGQISSNPSIALSNHAGGMINVLTGQTLSFNNQIFNAGQINVTNGALQLGGIGNQAGGIISLANGNLLLTGDNPVNPANPSLPLGMYNASGAILAGYGTIQSNFPIDNAGSIQLSGGSSAIYAAITNESGAKITVTGSSVATFYSPLTLKSGSALTVDINSTAVFFGNVTGTATISGAGTLDFEAGHSVTPALANLGGLTVGSLAALTVPSVQVGAVVVQGNLVIGPATPGQPKSLNTANTLTVTTGATLDLTNTDLLIHATTLAAVQNAIALNEIRSSSATANLTGLGLLAGSDFLTLHGPLATFDGSAVLPADVLVRFTYLGDATLDGKISVADYAQIDASFLLHETPSWLTGDFNLDGVVNYLDYALIDNAYRNQSGALAATEIAAHQAEFGAPYLAALAAADSTSVPEPAALGIILISAAALLRRRSNRIK